MKTARANTWSRSEDLAAFTSKGMEPVTASKKAIPWVMALPGSFNLSDMAIPP